MKKIALLLSASLLFLSNNFAQKLADVDQIIKKADSAWLAWKASREKIEKALSQEPWETDKEFLARKQSESYKASTKEMTVFDKAIAELRAGNFAEPSENIELKIEVDQKMADLFHIQVSGKNGAIAFEGKLDYKAKKASETKLFANPDKIKPKINYKLFPIGDFGGRYRELVRKVDIGGIIFDVLEIKDFDSGERNRAKKAKLFETVFVEGGQPILNYYYTGNDDKIAGPDSFYTTATHISQDVFLQVAGFLPPLTKGDRLDPWRAIDGVTWNESVAFCNALSKFEGFEPVFKKDRDLFTADLKANGWRMQSREEFYYSAVGGPKARFRMQIGGDGPNFMVQPSIKGKLLPVIGDSVPNELGIRDIYYSQQYWEPVGNRFDTRTTYEIIGTGDFIGNFDLGSNLRIPGFSFRIQRSGVAK